MLMRYAFLALLTLDHFVTVWGALDLAFMGDQAVIMHPVGAYLFNRGCGVKGIPAQPAIIFRAFAETPVGSPGSGCRTRLTATS